MTRLSRGARELINKRIDDHLEDIDASPLHNRIAVADDGDELVLHLAEAVARLDLANRTADGVYDRDDHREREDEYLASREELLELLHDRVDELVAEACGDAITDASEWAEHYETEACEQSVIEARHWLQDHQDAAERAGVWEVAR